MKTFKKTTNYDDTESNYTGNDSVCYPKKQSNHLAIMLLEEKVEQFKKEFTSLDKKVGFASTDYLSWQNRKQEIRKCISELEISIYKLKNI